MSKRLAGLLAILVSALVATPSATALSKPEVIRLLELPEGFAPLSASVDFEQLEAGDSFSFVQGLFAWEGKKAGKRLGHIDGYCQLVSAVSASGGATFYCAVSTFLPAGQILFQGFERVNVFRPGATVFPITGGTGHYRNARGWVQIRDIGSSGKTADVFHLVP